MARRRSVEEYAAGVRAGDHVVLAMAITLVESTNPVDQEQAQELLVELLPDSGGAHRVGITGVPGVGKSTFIEALGTRLTSAGHRVAVLAVDPTSTRTGGSILGDKTRMVRLSADPNAYIRPSPTSGTLGGVARATRETMVVCEAAGFDVILVETVGVGQSEVLVADMVDFFCVLMLAGAGDELQGIKKGIIELADLIAVNKAEPPNDKKASAAAQDYRNALSVLTPASPNWSPPVVTCSALEQTGLDELWHQVELHRARLTESGELVAKRRGQQLRWMWAMVEDRLLRSFRSAPRVASVLAEVEPAVAAGEITPTLGATRLLEAFGFD